MSTGILGPVDIFGSDVSGTQFEKMLCHNSLLGCEFAYVRRLGKPAFKMVILPLILELRVVFEFDFENSTPVKNHKATNVTFCCEILFNAKVKCLRKITAFFLVSLML